MRSPHEDRLHSQGCMAWMRHPSGVTKTRLQVGLRYSKTAFGLCQIGETRFEFVVDVSNTAGLWREERRGMRSSGWPSTSPARHGQAATGEEAPEELSNDHRQMHQRSGGESRQDTLGRETWQVRRAAVPTRQPRQSRQLRRSRAVQRQRAANHCKFPVACLTVARSARRMVRLWPGWASNRPRPVAAR